MCEHHRAFIDNNAKAWFIQCKDWDDGDPNNSGGYLWLPTTWQINAVIEWGQ